MLDKIVGQKGGKSCLGRKNVVASKEMAIHICTSQGEIEARTQVLSHVSFHMET